MGRPSRETSRSGREGSSESGGRLRLLHEDSPGEPRSASPERGTAPTLVSDSHARARGAIMSAALDRESSRASIDPSTHPAIRAKIGAPLPSSRKT